MFEFITDKRERGQVGIGTLIVFIAMVLVAAIAAGVLINTAGFLQSQAEATGEDSTDLVSERLSVTSSVGIVEDASDGTLEEIRLTVTGSPGADNIDLRDTTLQAVGPDGQENLVFEELDEGTDGVGDINAAQFAVRDSSGDFVGDGDSAVVGPDDQFTIILNPAVSPFDDDGEAFPEGSQSSIDIISPAGATTSVELRAPDLYNEDGEAVRL